jgi:hypothetical protein
MEVTLAQTLQCVVVEIEVQSPSHDYGPDYGCWLQPKRINFHIEAVQPLFQVVPRRAAL